MQGFSSCLTSYIRRESGTFRENLVELNDV